jgi:hypothetical protein
MEDHIRRLLGQPPPKPRQLTEEITLRPDRRGRHRRQRIDHGLRLRGGLSRDLRRFLLGRLGQITNPDQNLTLSLNGNDLTANC